MEISVLIPTFICMAIVVRLLTVAYSRRNEARLRAAGAVEFASGNTKLLAAAHTFFYLLGALEYGLRSRFSPEVGVAGVVLWLLAMFALVAVWAELRELWTVKILISPYHVMRRGSLYRYFRHPNYVLNIIPELVAYALATNAWLTLIVGLPLYLAVLWRRVQAEEMAMRTKFEQY